MNGTGEVSVAQASFVIAITAPISTKITIRIWSTIQKRGSSTGGLPTR
jgi:hypothetical protein